MKGNQLTISDFKIQNGMAKGAGVLKAKEMIHHSKMSSSLKVKSMFASHKRHSSVVDHNKVEKLSVQREERLLG